MYSLYRYFLGNARVNKYIAIDTVGLGLGT